ncbi:ester cyclase [Burkholderia stabilis]|uniref:ester cyclase n=1 Tax=Burkholderia stabilis TaxID=95485 RepID=UPI00158C1134|nr:ester cyclase [Burkholderia stabilis]
MRGRRTPAVRAIFASRFPCSPDPDMTDSHSRTSRISRLSRDDRVTLDDNDANKRRTLRSLATLALGAIAADPARCDTLARAVSLHRYEARMAAGDRAWNARDMHAVHDLHASDITLFQPGSNAPVQGADAHQRDVENLLAAFPDIRIGPAGPDGTPAYAVRFGEMQPDGRAWIGTVSQMTGTHTGALRIGADREIAPTGRAVDFRLATLALLDGEQIVTEYVFYDLFLIFSQLGVVHLDTRPATSTTHGRAS